MPKFGNGDGRNFKLIVGARRHPVLEVEGPFFAANNHVSVKDYRHLSPGVVRVLRAACKSRRHALASSSGSWAWPKTSAKSRPEQTFSSSGTSRATGEPFRRRMALPGGAMVEQLARQRLLLYAEGQEWIGATIEYGDRNYRPVPFDNELEDALHLPEATAEYECV